MFVDKIHCYTFGNYRLDITNNQLLKNGIPVLITQKSFDILRFLVENNGLVIKKEDLLSSLWEGNFVEENTLTQHIYMLRKVLRQGGNEENFIETVPKIGYRFVSEVNEVFYKNPEKRMSANSVYPDFSDTVSTNDEITYFKSLTESGKISAYLEEKNKNLSINPQPKFSINFSILTILLIFVISLFGYAILETNSFSAEQDREIPVKSIAVLPFQVIGESKDEKLGLGVTDVIISNLGNSEDIAVSPTSSISQFVKDKNLPEISEKLNVDAVLLGTIQEDKERVRITVQLYYVKDQNIIWSEKFDENYSNIFSLQDKISAQVTSKLLMIIKNNKFVPAFAEHGNKSEGKQDYF